MCGYTFQIIKYMSYRTCLLLLTLLVCSWAYTDIAMLNCPAQFDINLYNTTTDSTVASLGSFVYGAFQTSDSKKRVQSIVIKGDTNDLSKYISQMMAPYIIFGVIFILFFLSTVLCCLFDRSCPPCQALRRNLDEKPYSKRQKRVALVCTLIFASGVLITCIISFSFIPDMRKQIAMTKCSIYLSIDTAINGDGVWGGFISLRDQVGNITNLLSAAVTQIQIYFPGDSWLTDNMQTMQNTNLNIYKTYATSQLITPNPTTTETAANANQATPKIDSVFIKTGMGPNGTVNTMITDIDAQLRTTQKLANQGKAIETSANLIASSLNTILNNSLSSQNTLMMYNHQLQTMVSQFTVLSNKYFDDLFGQTISILQGVFAFALAGSMISLLGVIATHLFDLLNCRTMVHLGWTIFGIVYAGVLVITFLVLSVGSVAYGFCSYYKTMLTDQSAYNTLGISYTQNAFMRVDTCIFGSGNALDKFSLGKQMKTVQDLFTNIAVFYDYSNPLSTSYVNTATSPIKISGWINALNNYKLGIYVDSNPAQTNSDNPNYAIQQLNLYTYQGGGVNTSTKDVWVWDKINCTDPTQQIYTAQTTDGTNLSISNVTCLSFNQKLKISSTSSWSFSDFTKRYVQIRQNYPDAYRLIQYYGKTLIAFRDSRINLFQAIQDDLSDLLTQNNNFNTMLSNYRNRVNQFYSAVSTLNNLITNPLNGLIVSSNCNSLADKMRFTYNVFCYNFMAQIVRLVICCIALLILLLGGVIAGSRFGMMYAQQQKIKRITMPQQPQSQKDIHMEHNNDSASSNSNQED